MNLGFWTFALTSLLTAWMSTVALALPASDETPSEEEFWEAADRAVRRVYGEDVQAVAWREPARDIDTGGYAVCGTVSLRGRADQLTVLSHWHRGDMAILMVTAPANHAEDPYAARHDMKWPGVVFPTSNLEAECRSLAGIGSETWRGEPFMWREPPTLPVLWADISRTSGDRSLQCIPLSTEAGRLYRIRADATLDAHLVIASDCEGSDLLRWNEDTSTTDRNPTVEFEGQGQVYAVVGYRDGWAPYTLTVEEAQLHPPTTTPVPGDGGASLGANL